ncbi:MAG: hypothetical protein U0M05_08030 [Clostridia bacterium]|jgi:hypothetical protein|nr:hypothetical protein [Clostridia bacterium]
MEIYLDKLDSITQTKYQEFKEKVEELLAFYQETDPERYNLVKDKIEQTKDNWDTTIDLVNGSSRDSVDISQLLAYEYCLASERITDGKVTFEAMLDKLFDGVKKFRIGNPVPGMDDECLYGKGFDDPTAIPVTSKLYRMVMNAGAQHLDYFRDGSFTGAVFIYERGTIKGFAKDENGNPVDMKIDGIDFSDLSKGQSLLTNLRQTAFHEWTHNAEKQVIDSTSPTIDYEYQSEDGKTYRNYERINSYVTSENIGNLQEPQYIISTQRDSQGNRKRYFQDKNGNLRPLSEVDFGLEKKQLGTEYCFSSGLTTREVLPNGETRMHNIITEGFVEETARAMIRAIDPQVRDIDEEKYPEYVEMAKRVIESRDVNLGENEQGQTYADFLMHSSELKRDLESRTVVLDDGSKVDGLHYISNYADRVQSKQTRKSQFYRNMPNVAGKLNLSKAQIDEVRQSNLWQKRVLTEDEQNYLRTLLVGENPNNQAYVDTVVADFVDILGEEAEFFDGIAEKLGYSDRTIEGQKATQELVQESIKGVPDLTVLDEIEQVKARQQRAISNQRESQENTQNI